MATTKANKLLILDKDGTLTTTVSGERFVQHPQDQKLLPGVTEALQRYADDGWLFAIASNQGGVAAGHKTLDDAVAEMGYCLTLLPEFVQTAVFCPDKGETIEFVRKIHVQGQTKVLRRKYLGSMYSNAYKDFRKPGIGMIKTLRHFILDRDGDQEFLKCPCMFVGDRPEDELAASRADIPFMWAHEWRGASA